MIREYDVVVLLDDLPENGLKRGATGTVVMEFDEYGAEVEFTTLDGVTIAVVSVLKSQLRKASDAELRQLKDAGN